MSSLPEHIASYRERSWQVHDLPFDADTPELAPDPSILWCNSVSEQATRVADSPERLYVDLELLAADRDPSAGGDIGRLAADWNGHPAGTLTILSYEKIKEGKLVFLIEDSA